VAYCANCGCEMTGQGKACPNCGAAQDHGAGVNLSPGKSFFAAVFDFQMSEFIAPKIIRFVYYFFVAVMALSFPVTLVMSLSAARYTGIGPVLIVLFLYPVALLVGVVMLRIQLELVCAIFNIAGDLREIKNSRR